jgi:hypothetical protein
MAGILSATAWAYTTRKEKLVSSFNFFVLETSDVKKHEIILVWIELCPEQCELTKRKEKTSVFIQFFVLETPDVKKM